MRKIINSIDKPKTRLDRIKYLIENNVLEFEKYASALGKERYNFKRYFFGKKKEVNSLDYIFRAYECLGGNVSLTWLILGKQPYNGYEKIFSHKKTDIRKRIKDFLDEENLTTRVMGELLGVNASTIHRNLTEKAGLINVHYVIAIHICTGVSLDYLLAGVGPKYTHDKEISFIDYLEEHT